jgi:hypothetical protein
MQTYIVDPPDVGLESMDGKSESQLRKRMGLTCFSSRSGLSLANFLGRDLLLLLDFI